MANLAAYDVSCCSCWIPISRVLVSISFRYKNQPRTSSLVSHPLSHDQSAYIWSLSLHHIRRKRRRSWLTCARKKKKEIKWGKKKRNANENVNLDSVWPKVIFKSTFSKLTQTLCMAGSRRHFRANFSPVRIKTWHISEKKKKKIEKCLIYPKWRTAAGSDLGPVTSECIYPCV